MCAFSQFCVILHSLARRDKTQLHGFGAFKALKLHESHQFLFSFVGFIVGLFETSSEIILITKNILKICNFSGNKFKILSRL